MDDYMIDARRKILKFSGSEVADLSVTLAKNGMPRAAAVPSVFSSIFDELAKF